ncbi:MAG: substrate-binding domain-containing protein [Pseudomonadota bacterium]|nr:substrate-binding domain-containing protein [Pseudomonadota bacterium]
MPMRMPMRIGRRIRPLLIALASVALLAAPARAGEIRMLSAGAVELGLGPVLADFERNSGHVVRVEFAAAPALGPRLVADPGFDIVIAPAAVLDALAAAGKLGSGRASIGKVGIGIAVRASAELPEVGSVDALKAALLGADAVVFNRASTGLYVEKLLGTLGVAAALEARVVRVADGAAVMRRLLAGSAPHELGLGALTEIVLFKDQGLRLVGPLPAAIQNTTTYIAATAQHGSGNEAAAALMRHLQQAPARATFAQAGIEPAP